MQIPSHQIHNVLKVYSKQLSQTRIIERQKALGKSAGSDKINISAEGKRQAIIEKVATDIVERITSSGPRDEIEQEIINKLEDEIGQSIDFKANQGDNVAYQNNEFIFNVIDGDNEKTTNTLHVNDASLLLKRLEQLAKEAVDRNMAA
jgi:hypothetical protein